MVCVQKLAQPKWNGSAIAPKNLMNIAKNLGFITLIISLMLFNGNIIR